MVLSSHGAHAVDMRPSHHLGVLSSAALRNTGRLRGIVSRSASHRGVERDRCVAYAAIEAVNTWAEFSRAYYLSLVLGATRYERGAVHAVGACSMGHGCSTAVASAWDENAALAHAINRYRTRRFVVATGVPSWTPQDEPSWRNPRVIMELARDIGASNANDVDASFGIATRVFSDLPVFRHFFAHRSERTARAAMVASSQNLVSATLRPTDALMARPIGGIQPLILDWLDELESVVDDLCR